MTTNDWKKNRIVSCLNNTNPTMVMQLKSGFVVMCDQQFFPGYCLLIAYPQTKDLNDLPIQEKSQFLLDMALVGEAIKEVCSPSRINYAILMNKDPFLHVHITPRYDWESEEYKYAPIWKYPKPTLLSIEFEEKKHSVIKNGIKEYLKRNEDSAPLSTFINWT